MLTPGTILISLAVLTLSWVVQGGYVRLLSYALRKLPPLSTRWERVPLWLRNNTLSLLCLNLVPWSLWMLLSRPLFLRVLDVLGTATTVLGLVAALFGSLKLELGPVPSALLRWTRLLDRRIHRFLFHRVLLLASSLSNGLRKVYPIVIVAIFIIIFATRGLVFLSSAPILNDLFADLVDIAPALVLLCICLTLSGLVLSWLARRLLLISRTDIGAIAAFSICGLVMCPFLFRIFLRLTESPWYFLAVLLAPIVSLYLLALYLAFRMSAEIVWNLEDRKNASSTIQRTGFLASVAGGVLLVWSKLA